MKTTENLKEKLVAERQSKLLLEVKIRREMAEAMFRQLLETEEAWRQVTLQSSLRLKGFHIYKCIHLYIHICMYIHIYVYARHAYSRYLEKFIFKASDEKGRRSININL